MADANRNGAGAADAVASLTIALVAVLALALAWPLPWWIMKAQAPQYGQRTLVVEVGPRAVSGDVLEIDRLGHYVGIRPMGELAPLERALAPLGMLVAFFGLVAAPWLRSRWLRALAVIPVVVAPIVMLVDLKFWMLKAVTERDPDASLSLTVTSIDPKLFGAYDVGQFKVDTEFGAGFWLALVAGLLAVGLVFARPLSFRRRRTAVAIGTALAFDLVAAAVPGTEPAFGFVATAALGAELRVSDGYPSIASALAAARDGDTVLVPRGVHRERLRIERRVHLVGHPGAIIDGGGEGTVVRVEAPEVELRGLTVRGSGASYTTEDAGIRVERAAGVRIVDVQVEDALFGIFVVQGDRCVVEGSTVTGKDLPHFRRGDGIRLWHSSGCRLTGNRVTRSRDVVIWYSSDTVVEDNLVRTSRYGLHYMYSDRNTFRRNRFEDNQVGAAIMYSRGVDLEENAFSFSNGPAAYGLLLKDADDVRIVNNRFVGNATALFFDNAPRSVDGSADVHMNLIARNDVGVALQPLSQRIRLWENALVGNRIQVQILGTGNAEANLWAVGGRGNYWSDAVLYDADGDGVSDIPYRLESTYEVLADRYPVLAFFDGTPGAEAIDLAARLFPMFAPRPKLTDPHPLAAPPLTVWTSAGGTSGGAVAFGTLGGGLLALAGFGIAGGRALLS
jgi:nitrous oxidase accessory protein